MAIAVTDSISLHDDEVRFSAIRAQGAGGQNVNKVASAIELTFDIGASSLPSDIAERLRQLRDRRISAAGVVRIKAQRFRTQERNRADAVERLVELIRSVLTPKPLRKATRVPARAVRKRLDEKSQRSAVKRQRTRPAQDD